MDLHSSVRLEICVPTGCIYYVKIFKKMGFGLCWTDVLDFNEMSSTSFKFGTNFWLLPEETGMPQKLEDKNLN